MSSNIPDDVNKKIETESKDYMHREIKGFVGDFEFTTQYLEYAHKDGANFGYSLSQSVIAEKEKEIEEYKKAAETNYEQVIHLGTIATDQQARIEELEKEISCLKNIS